MNFFKEYDNLELVFSSGWIYCLRNKYHPFTHKPAVQFVFNGFEYDVFFGSGAYNQAFLAETMRMLEFLNKTVAIDNQPC